MYSHLENWKVLTSQSKAMELNSEDVVKYITKDDIQKIVNKCGYNDLRFDYYMESASDKMLGFLADYLRLKIHVTSEEKESRTVLFFFIKAVSRSNEAKAAMVKELKLFQKEIFYYTVIREKLKLNDLKSWSPELIAVVDDAVVFVDLGALQYKSRNKFARFDMAHSLQALNSLARFHAASIIYEEKENTRLQKPFRFNDEYQHELQEMGYLKSSPWFLQCMNGALEAVRAFSKYSKDDEAINKIQKEWENVWFSALDLCGYSTKFRNVISHRDLWNNNLMFHYKQVGDDMEPDDCVMVDYQAMLCQPPAGDVMLLLTCNLDPRFRENNLNLFLNYYYEELSRNLLDHTIEIDKILNKQEFLTSAEELRKWGLIACACLIPQFWVDDDLTTKTFTDTKQFNEILSENKGEFIKKMMHENSDYRNKVMEIFEEVIERYCM